MPSKLLGRGSSTEQSKNDDPLKLLSRFSSCLDKKKILFTYLFFLNRPYYTSVPVQIYCLKKERLIYVSISLFLLLSFFFWPLCCMSFFNLWILVPPQVSSNFSYVGMSLLILSEYVEVNMQDESFTASNFQVMHGHKNIINIYILIL